MLCKNCDCGIKFSGECVDGEIVTVIICESDEDCPCKED